MNEGPVANTDKEIWREREGDYYADSIHVTENGMIGMNCGGYVVVKPIREWHKLAMQDYPHKHSDYIIGGKPETMPRCPYQPTKTPSD